MKACLVLVQCIFTIQFQHFLTLLVGPGRTLKFEMSQFGLEIFTCLLSEIELILNILLDNSKDYTFSEHPGGIN